MTTGAENAIEQTVRAPDRVSRHRTHPASGWANHKGETT